MMTLLGVMQPAMPCISRVDFPCKVHDLVACITDMDNHICTVYTGKTSNVENQNLLAKQTHGESAQSSAPVDKTHIHMYLLNTDTLSRFHLKTKL